ncbi:glutathione S-transferase [Geopyxis carbonaria]|nr:glutathione S-transferase [Geopyxis carbonaria]
MSYSATNPQFTLFTHVGPNPWKVAHILRELNLTYQTSPVRTSDGSHKKPPYTTLNPNERMPTLIDHVNGDFVIWESGAIILYLIQKYDTAHVLSPATFNEQATAQQWLMFQMSGQGPMWGQYAWFMRFHHEQLESAKERYLAEIIRTIGVLDTALEGKEWLVGGKISYADLAFMSWCWLLELFPATKDLMGIGEKGDETIKHPNFVRWYRAMKERDSIKAVLEERTKETEANK